ncbi:UNVERIFIED_ORG: hypothetical protein GGE53_006367 [Rhizobium etli]
MNCLQLSDTASECPRQMNLLLYIIGVARQSDQAVHSSPLLHLPKP